MLIKFCACTCLALVSAVAVADEPPPPLVLNHFYVVLDSTTNKRIESDDFLKREFAAFERRTTVRTDETYTAIYFYGKHTYFEMFDEATRKTEKAGDSAIAFGVEENAAIATLAANMHKASIAGDLMHITRQLGEKQVQWFLRLETPDPDQGFRSWVMEYDPHFLTNWHPEADDLRSGISRDLILERYRHVLSSVPREPLLEDVTGLTVALTPAGIDRMRQLGAIWGVAMEHEGTSIRLAGPDFAIRLIPAAKEVHGIREATFRVARAPAQKAYRFGPHSVLEFTSGTNARWTF